MIPCIGFKSFHAVIGRDFILRSLVIYGKGKSIIGRPCCELVYIIRIYSVKHYSIGSSIDCSISSWINPCLYCLVSSNIHITGSYLYIIINSVKFQSLPILSGCYVVSSKGGSIESSEVLVRRVVKDSR